MSTLLSNLTVALGWAIPAILLVGRFFWPRYFPWWVIVICTAVASWALYEAQISLRYGVELDEQAECFAAAAHDPLPPRDCPLSIVHYWDAPIYLRWVGGVVCLFILLPVYGLAHMVRQRRQRVAA